MSMSLARTRDKSLQDRIMVPQGRNWYPPCIASASSFVWHCVLMYRTTLFLVHYKQANHHDISFIGFAAHLDGAALRRALRMS